MTKQEQEKRIVQHMITLYCKKLHKETNLCEECKELVAYAFLRVEKCPHKENIELITERGFFAEVRKQLKGLKLYTKIAMKVVEQKKRVLLLHVKL